jgi:site-specific recombinase XerD
VIGIELDDLDLAGGVVTLTKTKSGKARTIRLVDPVVQAMMIYLRHSESFRQPGVKALWLNRRGQALTPNGLSQMMERRGKQAGVKVSPHAFRRRQADLRMGKGGSEPGLMTNNGWTTTAMIRRYSKDVITANTMAEVDRLFGDT